MRGIYWKEIVRQLLLLLIIVPLSPVLLVWVILTGENGQTIENWSYKLLDLGEALRTVWRMFVDVVRLIAWITVIFFVAISVLLLISLVLHEFGTTLSWFEPYHSKAVSIFETKAAWAAITIIVASMAVIINQLKLEMEQAKFQQEQGDRRRKEDDEREARRRANLKP